MNDKARSIFLCPDCGGASAVADDGNAVCSECEKNFELPHNKVSKPQIPVSPRPSGMTKAKASSIQRNVSLSPKEAIKPGRAVDEPQAPPVQPKQNLEGLQKEKKDKGERRKRLKKRSKPPAKHYLKWIVMWLATVAIILLVTAKIQEQFKENSGNGAAIEERLVGEELLFYEQEFPGIRTQFQGFLGSRTVDQMAEFALDTKQLDRRMTTYYKQNGISYPNTGLDPNPVFWNVAFEESPGFVEVVWEAPGANFFETVFVKKGKKWLLDWEQFVRYAPATWSLFRQQVGTVRRGVSESMSRRWQAEKVLILNLGSRCSSLLRCEMTIGGGRRKVSASFSMGKMR